jgi:hypothetical protein
MTFIIVYELAQPGLNKELLVGKIKEYGSWARITDSSYLISTEIVDPTAVREYLATVLRTEDKLYVGASTRPSAWRGTPEEVSKWILANQR